MLPFQRDFSHKSLGYLFSSISLRDCYKYLNVVILQAVTKLAHGAVSWCFANSPVS